MELIQKQSKRPLAEECPSNGGPRHPEQPVPSFVASADGNFITSLSLSLSLFLSLFFSSIISFEEGIKEPKAAY